jgi:hypothetical protein
LATPREILQQLADQADLKISNLKRVPHDLWPRTSIPPLTWSDRLTLVLAGFHATFRVDAEQGQIALSPIPQQVSYQALASPRPISASLMEKLVQQYPTCTLQNTPQGLQVQGEYEHFEEIARLLRGEKVMREVPGGREKRYSLKVINQPVGGVIKALAQRLDLTLEWDPVITAEKQRERVSFEVRDATMRQLLQAALAPAALDFRLQGQRLQVSPRP